MTYQKRGLTRNQSKPPNPTGKSGPQPKRGGNATDYVKMSLSGPVAAIGTGLGGLPRFYKCNRCAFDVEKKAAYKGAVHRVMLHALLDHRLLKHGLKMREG